MKTRLILATGLLMLAMPLAHAQGIVGGAQQGANEGAYKGGRVAGPVGAAAGTVVGGTVGAAVGGAKGAIGVPNRRHCHYYYRNGRRYCR